MNQLRCRSSNAWSIRAAALERGASRSSSRWKLLVAAATAPARAAATRSAAASGSYSAPHAAPGPSARFMWVRYARLNAKTKSGGVCSTQRRDAAARQPVDAR